MLITDKSHNCFSYLLLNPKATEAEAPVLASELSSAHSNLPETKPWQQPLKICHHLHVKWFWMRNPCALKIKAMLLAGLQTDSGPLENSWGKYPNPDTEEDTCGLWGASHPLGTDRLFQPCVLELLATVAGSKQGAYTSMSASWLGPETAPVSWTLQCSRAGPGFGTMGIWGGITLYYEGLSLVSQSNWVSIIIPTSKLPGWWGSIKNP